MGLELRKDFISQLKELIHLHIGEEVDMWGCKGTFGHPLGDNLSHAGHGNRPAKQTVSRGFTARGDPFLLSSHYDVPLDHFPPSTRS